MIDFLGRLFDTEGFVPRRMSPGWTGDLIWLHTTSDILIWLACLALALVIGYVFFRRKIRGAQSAVWLVCAAIVSLGLIHAFDAASFQRGIPRAVGLAKAITAGLFWVLVIVLVMKLPDVLELLKAERRFDEQDPLLLTRSTGDSLWGYLLSALCIVLATIVRVGFQQFVGEEIQFAPFVLAVVVAAWYGGLGPALLALMGGSIIASTLFRHPDEQARLAWISQELSLGFFVLSGVAVTLISVSEKEAKRRAEAGLWELVRRREELEAEIRQRETVEQELRRREETSRTQALDLAEANRRTAETLALLDTFVLYAPVGMAFIDHEHRLLRVNQSLTTTCAQEMRYGPQEEHQGQPIRQAFPELAQALEPHLEHVRVSGETVLGQIVGLPAGGRSERPRTLQVSCFPVSVGRTSLIGTGLIVQNITDQVQVENELRASEARYRSLAEVVPQLVWETDAAGQATYFNERWMDFTGLSLEQSLGGGWEQALDPEDVARTYERWHKSVREGSTYEVEYRLRSLRGAPRWFLARGVPQRATDGSIVRWLGTCTDIEDLKHAQNDLARSELRFRLLSNSIPQIVWTATTAGDVDYFSPQWHEYSGLALEQCAGRGWLKALHPDDREEGYADWDCAVRDGTPYEAQQRLRRASDDAYRWHLIRGVPVRDVQGATFQWVGTITDIDDQKRQAAILESLVRERTAELERSNRELELFASIASHDLQEPLRKIQAFGDRLQSRCGAELGDAGKDFLTRILTSAERMRRLINDLLTFSRVTTKARPFNPVALSAVAREVLADIEDQVTTSGGEVQVGALPTIAADPTQMRQLLQNLISNGLKFRHEGVIPRVRISARWNQDGEEPGECEIRVEDNGIGFDTVYLDRIFQVFQRLHGRSQYEGTGVGLAICRKIVERHHGEITAESTPDEGSTFIVRLPMKQTTEDAPEYEPAAGEAYHDPDGR